MSKLHGVLNPWLAGQDAMVETIPSCVSASWPALYDPIAAWRSAGSWGTR